MSLYSRLKPKGSNGFGYGSTAEDVTAGLALGGKSILITGCNSGLGLEAMRVLALRGAHVVGAARTQAKAQAAITGIKGSATGVACELSDPASIRACIDTVKTSGVTLDAIICNAGIMALPTLQQAYGCELQFFTNHIGHFMLVNGLLDNLAANGRVVVLSSTAHTMAPKEGIQFGNLSGERDYKPWTAYGQSKFANLLFAKELARRMSGTKRTANAVHPGVINTNLMRYMNMPRPAMQPMLSLMSVLAMKNAPQGAATECYVAVHPEAAALTGLYFADCNIAAPRADADDPVLGARLWAASEAIIAALP